MDQLGPIYATHSKLNRKPFSVRSLMGKHSRYNSRIFAQFLQTY